MKKPRLLIEPLETRSVPATLVNPFTVTYTSTGGEKTVVTISEPVFEAGTIDQVFHFDQGSVNGDNSAIQELTELDLTGLAAAGAVVKITSLSLPNQAEVGVIDATGLDLAAVFVNLGVDTVLVGDADLSTPGLGRLKCFSLDSRTNPSVIQGDLLTVQLSGELRGFLDVNGSVQSFKTNRISGTGGDDSGRLRCAGSLGVVRIADTIDGNGGASFSGMIEAGGNIDRVVVGGSVRGASHDSGQIISGGDIGSVRIGEFLGAFSNFSPDLFNVGRITAVGRIGKISIGGDVIGDRGASNGSIFGGAGIGSVTIGGDLIGGEGEDSGSIVSFGDIDVVRIGGSIVSRDAFLPNGENSARISTGGTIGKVSIGGSVGGDEGNRTGSIFGGDGIGSVTIGGDLLGGAGVDSGAIFTQTGSIGKVTIGGSIVSGTGQRSGSVRAAFDLGALKVVGDLDGSIADGVIISAFGQLTPGFDTDIAIGSVLIGGNVTKANILAGFNTLGFPFNKDAQIGTVNVRGDWTGSSIAAGVDDGADNLFGTNDDTLVNEVSGGDANIVARIGKITIGGTADGTAGGSDGFGIVAEEIGSLAIDGVFIALTAGTTNDTAALGSHGDFNLKEV